MLMVGKVEQGSEKVELSSDKITHRTERKKSWHNVKYLSNYASFGTLESSKQRIQTADDHKLIHKNVMLYCEHVLYALHASYDVLILLGCLRNGLQFCFDFRCKPVHKNEVHFPHFQLFCNRNFLNVRRKEDTNQK